MHPESKNFVGKIFGWRLLLLLALSQLHVPSLLAIVEFRPCKNDYSPQQQIQLGDRAKAQVYQQIPVLPDSNPVTRYIQHLGEHTGGTCAGL
jgi:beta-barrel assembly-enhancing protease